MKYIYLAGQGLNVAMELFIDAFLKIRAKLLQCSSVNTPINTITPCYHAEHGRGAVVQANPLGWLNSCEAAVR